MDSTIRLNQSTKAQLDLLRQYKNESYNELIQKLLFIAKKCEKNPELSQKTVQEIKESRKRIKQGNFYSEEEAKKILGL